MELEIRVDRVRYIGSGECVRLAPGVFDQDDHAISVVVDPRGAPEERIVQTMTACDEHHELLAILTTGAEGGWPDETGSRTSAHLRNEAEAYSAITTLVDPRLVATFEHDHARIEPMLARGRREQARRLPVVPEGSP